MRSCGAATSADLGGASSARRDCAKRSCVVRVRDATACEPWLDAPLLALSKAVGARADQVRTLRLPRGAGVAERDGALHPFGLLRQLASLPGEFRGQLRPGGRERLGEDARLAEDGGNGQGKQQQSAHLPDNVLQLEAEGVVQLGSHVGKDRFETVEVVVLPGVIDDEEQFVAGPDHPAEPALKAEVPRVRIRDGERRRALCVCQRLSALRLRRSDGRAGRASPWTSRFLHRNAGRHGPDEGRGWRGFHHHATLCIAAYAFLAADSIGLDLRSSPMRAIVDAGEEIAEAGHALAGALLLAAAAHAHGFALASERPPESA